MEISPEKSEKMTFLRQDNKCLQVKNFIYLGCKISYKNEKDIQQKVAKFAQILGILNNTFKPTSVQKSSSLLHGSEIWILR
jgi:hypothetical protein